MLGTWSEPTLSFLEDLPKVHSHALQCLPLRLMYAQRPRKDERHLHCRKRSLKFSPESSQIRTQRDRLAHLCAARFCLPVPVVDGELLRNEEQLFPVREAYDWPDAIISLDVLRVLLLVLFVFWGWRPFAIADGVFVGAKSGDFADGAVDQTALN